MADFWLVLRMHLRLSLRNLGRGRGRGLIGAVIAVLLFAAVGVATAYGSHRLFSSLGSVLGDYPEIQQLVVTNFMLLAGIITVAFVLTNAMQGIYAAVFMSEDTGYLLAMPLNPRSLFGARLAGSYLTHIAAMLPVTFGPFLALGLASRAGASYYAAMTLGYVAYLAIVVGIAALFITIVLAFVPGSRMKQILMISGLLVGVVLVFGIQYLTTTILARGDLSSAWARFAGLSLGGQTSLLPHVWLARVAVGAAYGADGWMLYLALLLAVALALAAVLIGYAGAVYVRGWASLQDVGTGKRAARGGRQVRLDARPGRSALAHPLWAVAKKDFLVSLRSPIHWYLLAIGLIVVGFQIVNLMGGHSVPGGRELFVTGMIIAGASMNSVVMAGSALSREGESFGLLRTMPVRGISIYWSKILAALPLPLVFVSGALIGVSRIPSLGMTSAWPYMLIAMMTLPSMFAVLLLLDALMPDFGFDQGMQPGSRRAGGTVIKLLVLVYGSFGLVALLMSTIALPGYYTRFAWLSGLTPDQVRPLSYALFGLLTLGVVAVVPPLGARLIEGAADRGRGGGSGRARSRRAGE